MSRQNRFTKEQREARNQIYEIISDYPYYVEEYIEDMFSSNASPSSLLGYLHDYKTFFNWLMAEGITDATSMKDIPLSVLEKLPLKSAQSYFSYLLYDLELSNNAINRKKSSLRSLFKFLTERTEDENGESYFYRNVMAKIKLNKDKEDISVRAERISKMIITEEEIFSFLDFIENEYENKINQKSRQYTFFQRDKSRNLAIISLLLASGIRVGELVNIKLDDININNKKVHVFRKGSKKSVVHFREFALPYLKDYLNQRKEIYQVSDDETHLFVTKYKGTAVPMSIRSVQYIVEKLTKAYPGINERRSPHKLRHSFATNYAKKNSLYDLMRQLGHNSTNTSILYVNANDESARKAIERLDKK